MKHLSRLTALLLALALLVSTSAGAFAESDLYDLTRKAYERIANAAQQAADAEAAKNQPISIIPGGGLVYTAQETPAKRYEIYEITG